MDGAPKDAKAPEPRPKALDAPTVGDDMAGDANGMELKGLDFPWEEVSPPYRLPGV